MEFHYTTLPAIWQETHPDYRGFFLVGYELALLDADLVDEAAEVRWLAAINSIISGEQQ